MATRVSGALGTPIPVLVGSFVIPYLIAYSVHFPNTRILRLGLIPLGLICGLWTITSINLPNPLMTLPLSETINLNAGTQYAFLKDPPTYASLRTEPHLSTIRHSTPFKALNLLIDANRLISLKPNPTPHITYLKSIMNHSAMITYHNLMRDLATYPVFTGMITPSHPIFGLHTYLGSVVWTLIMGVTMYHGTSGFMELFALIGVGSGLYNGEEWPKSFNAPLKSSSLNEFWGKRYHQLMRGLFLRLAKPLENGPKALHILAVFFNSGIYHIILYYPFAKAFKPYPHMFFWIGSGMGCLIERGYYKLTGKKVGGWLGRVWVIAWFTIVARPMVLFEAEYGWIRNGIMFSQEAKGEDSMINWVIYALGLPGPLDWKRT